MGRLNWQVMVEASGSSGAFEAEFLASSLCKFRTKQVVAVVESLL